MRNYSIDSRLSFAYNAISNALRNDDIKKAMLEYGYDDASIKSGRTLYEEAHTLHSIQLREYGDQLFVTNDLIQAKAEANIIYVRHLKLARIALRDSYQLSEVIYLNDKTSFSLFGWLDQVNIFYNRINNPSSQVDLLLKNIGLTEEKLKAGHQKVKVVEAKLNLQLKKDGEAHKSTKKRDNAFDVMNDWVTDFIEIASIALESRPESLEILGLSR